MRQSVKTLSHLIIKSLNVNVKSKCEKSYKFYFLPPKMAEMYSENALSDVE